MLALINEEWSIAYFMNLGKSAMSSAAESSGIKSFSFIENNAQYILAAGGFTISIISMTLAGGIGALS
jgi:hypothetical protein